MGITRDEHTVDIQGTPVAVVGTTGPVHATRTLLIDGAEGDRASAAGDFRLHGAVADGSKIVAEVHQRLLGPSRATIRHGDDEVGSFKGFVA